MYFSINKYTVTRACAYLKYTSEVIGPLFLSGWEIVEPNSLL